MFFRLLIIIIFVSAFASNVIFPKAGNIISETDDLILEDANTLSQTQEEQPEEAVKKNSIDYVSIINSLRDPFYRVLEQFGLKDNVYSLERHDLIEFKLKGVVWGIDSPTAMFEGPDKQKYILKKGSKIGRNNGVIMEIDKGQVQILETYADIDGNKMEKSTIKKVTNANM